MGYTVLLHPDPYPRADCFHPRLDDWPMIPVSSALALEKPRKLRGSEVGGIDTAEKDHATQKVVAFVHTSPRNGKGSLSFALEMLINPFAVFCSSLPLIVGRHFFFNRSLFFLSGDLGGNYKLHLCDVRLFS